MVRQPELTVNSGAIACLFINSGAEARFYDALVVLSLFIIAPILY